MTASEAAPISAVVSRLREAGCVFAEDEARLLVAEAGSAAELDDMVGRRVTGEPLEQVVGWAGFCGLRIAVDPGVFVPRRRTEFLVREAAGLVDGGGCVVIDLCCGSGAVGAALLSAVDGIQVHAVDVEPAAVACARRNLEDLGGQVYLGDLYAPLPSSLQGRIDLIVANAPYVPTEEVSLMPAEARLHEPRVALDGGEDGLDVQRRVAQTANRWLSSRGHLLIETSRRQAPTTVEILTAGGLSARVVTSEELDATVVVGSARGSRPLR